MSTTDIDFDAAEIAPHGPPDALEAQVYALVQEQYAVLRRDHPAWWYQFEEGAGNPNFGAERSDLLELAATAPNGFAIGLVFGKIDLRDEIARHTGIAY